MANAEYHRQWRAKNRGKTSLYSKRWAEKHPERVRARMIRRYGLTVETYELLVRAQGNCCAVCRKPGPVGRKHWDIDHNHTTNRVRGLLCHRCNKMLGLADDDPLILEAGSRYLHNES